MTTKLLDMDALKVCNGPCGLEKRVRDFYVEWSRRAKPYVFSKCKVCTDEKNKAWKAENQDLIRRNRRRHALKKYGLTLEQYEAMVDAVGGACELCGTVPDKQLSVDHCHTTGVVRGLLCQRCNMGIGYFDDDIERIAGVVTYLQERVA
jgi:hypothetical protein